MRRRFFAGPLLIVLAVTALAACGGSSSNSSSNSSSSSSSSTTTTTPTSSTGNSGNSGSSSTGNSGNSGSSSTGNSGNSGSSSTGTMPSAMPGSGDAPIDSPAVRQALINDLAKDPRIPSQDDAPIVDCVISQLKAAGINTVSQANAQPDTVRSDAAACARKIVGGG